MKPILLFDFESSRDRALAVITKLFQRAGAHVVSSDVAAAPSKRAGVAFRSVSLTFADGQVVILNVKTTGDVFEVKINGAVVPLKNQDDQGEAVKEIAAWLDKKRAAFQRALTKVKTVLPPSIRISAGNAMKAKVIKRDALVEAVGIAKTELAQLTAG